MRPNYPQLNKTQKEKLAMNKVMMATQQDFDEKQEVEDNQEEEIEVANPYFMANISSDDEDTKVEIFEPQLSYDELSNAYDELLNDSRSMSSQYAMLKRSFKILSSECLITSLQKSLN